MTKKRTATSSGSTTKLSNKSYREKILARVLQAQKKPIVKVASVITAIAVVWLCYYFGNVECVAQYAVLYAFGVNGRMSGRASNSVWMRNGRSRQMVVPALVQNDATSTQRSSFATLSSAWNALTEGQRKSWNVIGGYFRTDRFGNTIILSGKALFVALNRALFNIGLPQINTAPISRSVVGASTLSVAIDDSATSMILTFTPTPIPADNAWEIFATAPQSAGTFSPSASAYRLITVLPAATATGADVYTEYSDKFGAPPIGSKVFIKVVAVNTLTGQQSPGHIAFSIVVA